MAKYKETIKRIMSDDFSTATEEEKAETIKRLIEISSISAGVVAWQPIVMLDVALLSPIQILLVQAIARVHGHKLDKRSVIEILSTFGASILAQTAILSAAKLVPFAGWLVSISMAYALTYAVGEVSNHYFLTGRGASPDELKSMFKRVYQEKKAEKKAKHKENATLKDKIEQLKQARKSGLISEEEFEKKKEELLASF